MKFSENCAIVVENFTNSLKKGWIELIATICLFILTGIISITIYPKMRATSYDNLNERYAYSGETIGSVQVGFFIIVIPFVTVGAISLVLPKKIDLWYAYLSLIQTLALTLLITEALKVTVARPRPNYFSYCGYNVTTEKCHGKQKHQRDARLSFPSGHSSNSFSSGTWLTLFLSFIFPQEQIWWILIKFIPIAIATFVSATRIIDYMHHVSDVVGGAMIGVGIALMIFSAQSSRIFICENSQEDEPLLVTTDSVVI